jgi:very-short-patch-repair endonuclease
MAETWHPTPTPPALLLAARELRRTMTDAERRLWRCLRGKQLAGYRFRKQHPIDRFVLDFYCPAARLAIELDGGQHHTDAGRESDATRTAWLENRGIRVLRFWNDDVLQNTDSVVQTIWDVLHQNAPSGAPR